MLLGDVHVVVAEVVVVVDGVGLIKDLQNPLLLVPEMHHCYRSNNNNGQMAQSNVLHSYHLTSLG